MDDSQAPHIFTSWDDIPPEESPAVVAPAEVDFLTPSPAHNHLLDATTYRPGAVVASALLVGPLVCALIAAIIAHSVSAISVWLALALLLWLPALALAWALLKSVRLSPEAITCWRPLGSSRTLAFAEIERIEQRGPRIVVRSRDGQTLSFAPLLLGQGADLRRSLLLQAAPRTLAGDLRAEAHALENSPENVPENDVTAPTAEDAVEGILSIRTPARWPTLTLALAIVLAASAALAIWGLAWPFDATLAAALLALAGALAYLGLWTAQDIFVSEKGALIHYRLLRRERDIFWTNAWLIEFTPGELALRFRGGRDVICAGPGLFAHDDAARLREYILRYATAPVEPVLARRKG